MSFTFDTASFFHKIQGGRHGSPAAHSREMKEFSDDEFSSAEMEISQQVIDKYKRTCQGDCIGWAS
jgi:hypothetical protein